MAAVDRSLVAHLPLFAGLSAVEIDSLLKEARALRHPKNTNVFEQGADAHSLFLLLHGHVRAEKTTPHGGQIVVRYVSAGEIFGVAEAIGLKTYPATAVAAVDSMSLAWPSAAWPRMVAAHPALAANTLQTVGARLQDAHTRVMEMTTEEVERRIAHAILRLVKQAGRKVDDGIEIDFPITRQDLAELTGTTLHTVSRILSAWEQLGLVVSDRQRITLRDPHRLFALAENASEA
jgi:CRP/FNR family transcriptional regulator, nitrogen oxide reductase regulator